MKNKNVWIIALVFLIIFFLLFIAKSIDEDSWICTNIGWIQHGKPSMNKPMVPCGKNEEKLAVEKYLRENISNISPIKEVLGGKFYITKINWTENNSGTVEYEDGHILIKATFDYKILTNNNNDFSVIINNFNAVLQ